MNEYGPLGHTVATAGAVMAAVAAIGLAWRGRASWEPAEQDLPSGPQKVGGLVAAVAIVLLWSRFTDAAALDQLRTIAIVTVVVTVVALLLYGALVAVQTYIVLIATSPTATQSRKIVGGFWLRSEAAATMRKKKVPTVQELLAGARYDPDRLWSRWSRALAKGSFVVCYLALTTFGSAALTALALIVDLSVAN